jgi:hypothetical protein
MIKLKAPEKYWKLSEEERKAYSNGCGTDYFSVPNSLWGQSIIDA